MKSEFERLRKAGLKFSPALLSAMDIVTNSTGQYHANLMIEGTRLIEKITPRWITNFQEKSNIFYWKQCGKLSVSEDMQRQLEKSVAYHLGVVSRQFEEGLLDEDMCENVDETHFIINMDNGKTLGFAGDTEVRYADVVSGGLNMTMVVRLTGMSTLREVPFLCGQKKIDLFPIIDRWA